MFLFETFITEFPKYPLAIQLGKYLSLLNRKEKLVQDFKTAKITIVMLYLHMLINLEIAYIHIEFPLCSWKEIKTESFELVAWQIF